MGNIRQQKLGFTGRLSPTGIDPNAGTSLRQLAGITEGIGDIAFNIGAKKSRKEGELAGTTEGARSQLAGETLTLKSEGFFGSIESEAYNRTVKSAYLASLDNQNRTEIARLASENPTDLVKFNTLVSKYKAGVLGSVGEEVSPLAEVSINSLIASAGQKIQTAEITKNVTESDNALVFATQTAARDVMRFANEGDLQGAADSLSIAFNMIEQRVQNGQLDASAAKVQKRDLQIQTDIEVNRFTFENLVKNKGIIPAIEFLQQVSDKPLKGFGVNEQRDLVDVLKSDLNNFISLGDKKESEEDESREDAQKEESGNLFIGISSGESSASDVMFAVKSKSISAEQGRGLLNTLNTRGQGIDDHVLINDINSLLETSPDIAARIIQDNTGTRLTSATSTALLGKLRELEDSESPLKTSQAKRFKSFLANSVKVVGPLGAIDFESQKRLAELSIVYDERVLAGENPALIARELVDINSFLTAPNPITGTKDNLPEALKELDRQFDAKTMTDETYNQQYQLILDLMDQKSNLDQFERLLKEALKDVE